MSSHDKECDNQSTWIRSTFFDNVLTLFTKQQNSKLLQIESISRRQNKCDSKIEISFEKDRNICGKRKKCWLPAFSPFPTMVSKGVIKSQDCVVMG